MITVAAGGVKIIKAPDSAAYLRSKFLRGMNATGSDKKTDGCQVRIGNRLLKIKNGEQTHCLDAIKFSSRRIREERFTLDWYVGSSEQIYFDQKGKRLIAQRAELHELLKFQFQSTSVEEAENFGAKRIERLRKDHAQKTGRFSVEEVIEIAKIAFENYSVGRIENPIFLVPGNDLEIDLSVAVDVHNEIIKTIERLGEDRNSRSQMREIMGELWQLNTDEIKLLGAERELKGEYVLPKFYDFEDQKRVKPGKIAVKVVENIKEGIREINITREKLIKQVKDLVGITIAQTKFAKGKIEIVEEIDRKDHKELRAIKKEEKIELGAENLMDA